MTQEKSTLENKTIEPLVKNGFCTGCGTCVALCPSNAISITEDVNQGIYVPKIHLEHCNHCGICRLVCPGFENETKKQAYTGGTQRFSEPKHSNDIGSSIACYFGHSTDCNLRRNSSSGGLITALLAFSLEKGLIDGALVTKMDKDKPLRPKSFIAYTKEEILEAAKSKYCPVPANIALKEILNKNGKYAIVGLPCHITGARKSEKVKKELEKRIKFHFGLFCSHNNSFHQTEYFLQNLKIDLKDVNKIAYRGEGWPGQVSIELKSGDIAQVPYSNWAVYHEYCLFAPRRCVVCCDGTAELSDISFGDAWFPKIIDENRVWHSVILSRNKKGENLLQMAVKSGVIELTEAQPYALDIIQKRAALRRKGIKAKLVLLRLSRKQLADLKVPSNIFPESSDYIRSAIVFMNRYVASKRHLWGIIQPLLRFEKPLRKWASNSE